MVQISNGDKRIVYTPIQYFNESIIEYLVHTWKQNGLCIPAASLKVAITILSIIFSPFCCMKNSTIKTNNYVSQEDLVSSGKCYCSMRVCLLLLDGKLTKIYLHPQFNEYIETSLKKKTNCFTPHEYDCWDNYKTILLFNLE